jgi:hypothetical protein
MKPEPQVYILFLRLIVIKNRLLKSLLFTASFQHLQRTVQIMVMQSAKILGSFAHLTAM